MAFELAEPLTNLLNNLEQEVQSLIETHQSDETETSSSVLQLSVQLAFKGARLKLYEHLKALSGREFCAELRESAFKQPDAATRTFQ